MATRTRWTIAVRCYLCRQKFTLRHLELDTVFTAPLVTFCPHCGSELHVTSGPGAADQAYLYRIDLREETEAIFRKTSGSYLWHFSESCSQWPTDDYLQLEIQPDVGELCGECKTKQRRIKVH